MVTIFYIILVWFTYLRWNWWWFLLSLVFSALASRADRIIYKYKYTNDPRLNEEEATE